MTLAAVAGASAGNAALQQLVLDVRDSWDQSLHSQRLLPGLRLQQQQQQQVPAVTEDTQQRQEVPLPEDMLPAAAAAEYPAATDAATPTPAAAAAAEVGQVQRVQFSTQLKLDFGQAVAVLGSCSSLGDWQASRAVQLQWSEGHRWSGTAELPAG
jgi:hypothetical protein